MSDLYKKSFRGYLIDHHSPAPPTVDFTRLDMKEYEAFYQEANINSLMVYTKDHWGYSYYDTKIGTKHPGLTIDYIGQVSKILKERGIEFNAYYCLEYDTLAPKKYPDWAIRDKDCHAVTLTNRRSPAKWGMPCYETGYRDYVLGQLAEVVEQYHPDSLFLDIFGKSLCYCEACRKKFKARYGYDLPKQEGIVEGERVYFDFGQKGRDVNEFLEDCAYEMLRDVLKTVKAIDPALKVTINFAALYPKKIRDLLDYQFTEPWAGNWLSAAYSRDTSKAPCPQLGPGDVSEVYNYRPDSVYELAGAQITANGCRSFFYSGSQHVDGTLEHREAAKVGKAYREIEQYEPYLTGRRVLADVAIIQSDSSSMAKSGSRVVLNAIGRVRQPDPHKEALKGAMMLCDYAKLSFQIIPEEELTKETAAGFSLILLAGVFHISGVLKEVLEDFAENGGSILAAGECGLYGTDGTRLENFTLNRILGCDFIDEITDYSDQQYGGYLMPDSHPVFKGLTDTFPPMGNIQYKVTPSTGQGMGKIMNPCTRVTPDSWVNWWCPPPAMTPLNHPAVVKNGSCFYVAYDLFQTYQLNLNRNLFVNLMEECVKAPKVYLDTPCRETISYCAYEQGDKIIIHVLSHLADKTNGDAPAVSPGKLRIHKRLAGQKSASLVYPEKQALTCSEYEDYIIISLPDVTIQLIVVLE